jgi:hypothetical protein
MHTFTKICYISNANLRSISFPPFLILSSTLKINIYQTTRYHVSEDIALLFSCLCTLMFVVTLV